MHPFVFLGPALALLLGQADPASPPEPAPAAEPEAPAARESPQQAPPADAPAPPARRSRTQVQAPAAADQPRPAAPARTLDPERTQVARAALAFLDALLAGNADALASASTVRFSFDGDVRTGKDDLRRAWRGFLAGRDASKPGALLDLELLPSADAVSRLGPPPARLAPLAGARGTWVAVANVSRRPVVLFLVRESNRWAVAGIE
jgi:hypothetical protein